MIDIHTHILPGMDDGASDFEESVNMCIQAASDGTKTLILTPHFKSGFLENSRSKILKKTKKLKKRIKKQQIDLTLLPGSEVTLSPDLPVLIEENRIMTLNDGGRYLLLELPYQGVEVEKIKELVFQISVRDITPILAHPERYSYIQKDPEIMEELINQGVLSQITGSSLHGDMGFKSKETALYFLERGLVHFFASDAHNDFSRKPLLSEAAEELKKHISKDYYLSITKKNPRKMLEGESVETDRKETAGEEEKGSSFMERIFSSWSES